MYFHYYCCCCCFLRRLLLLIFTVIEMFCVRPQHWRRLPTSLLSHARVEDTLTRQRENELSQRSRDIDGDRVEHGWSCPLGLFSCDAVQSLDIYWAIAECDALLAYSMNEFTIQLAPRLVNNWSHSSTMCALLGTNREGEWKKASPAAPYDSSARRTNQIAWIAHGRQNGKAWSSVDDMNVCLFLHPIFSMRLAVFKFEWDPLSYAPVPCSTNENTCVTCMRLWWLNTTFFSGEGRTFILRWMQKRGERGKLQWKEPILGLEHFSDYNRHSVSMIIRSRSKHVDFFITEEHRQPLRM